VFFRPRRPLLGAVMIGGIGAMATPPAARASATPHVGRVSRNASPRSIALLEHRRAVGLRHAVGTAGGVLLGAARIHHVDPTAVGLIASDEAAELLGSTP
jgi:hypothetical protein